MRPIAIAVASEEPEAAANPAQAKLVATASPPGRPLPPERRDDGYEGSSDCTSGMGTFNIALVAARRYPVVDEEAQVVLGAVVFLRNPGATQRRKTIMIQGDARVLETKIKDWLRQQIAA